MEKDQVEIEVRSGSGNDSTQDKMLEEQEHHKEEDTSHKRKREHTVEEIVLPFAKDPTRWWKEIESKEVFTRTPQRPHFAPLVEKLSECLREAGAYGLMLQFAELTEKVEKMDKDVPVSQLELYKRKFALLEEHGFSATDSLSLINDLLSSAKEDKHRGRIWQRAKSCTRRV